MPTNVANTRRRSEHRRETLAQEDRPDQQDRTDKVELLLHGQRPVVLRDARRFVRRRIVH